MSGSYLSLFSGIGGLDLAVEAFFGFEPTAFVEVDESCRRVLERQWPGIPVFGDIRSFSSETLTDSRRERYGGEQDGRVVGRVGDTPEGGRRTTRATRELALDRSPKVDLVCGGFPCQDLSNAGKGKGFKGQRSALFYELARVVSEVGPRFVLLENVRGLLTAGGSLSSQRGSAMGEVLGTLSDLGFAHIRWVLLGAKDVGAPHHRNRIFILATAKPESLGCRVPRQGFDPSGKGRQNRTAPVFEHPRSSTEFGWGVYEPAIRRWEELTRPAPYPVDERGRLDPEFPGWMMGFPAGWNAEEPRPSRLKQFGNAVVWQQAYAALNHLTATTSTP